MSKAVPAYYEIAGTARAHGPAMTRLNRFNCKLYGDPRERIIGVRSDRSLAQAC
jgi:hypothetical protein